MKFRFSIMLFILCNIYTLSRAQELQQIDLTKIIKQIPHLPGTLKEVHQVFTINTPGGEKIQYDKLLNPPYYYSRKLLSIIHDKTIREKMKEVTRKDYPDSIIYDDIRWKLSLRPLINSVTIEKMCNKFPAYRDKLIQIIELQTVLNYIPYYKEDDTKEKSERIKLAQLNQGNNSLESARKKLAFQKEIFAQKAKTFNERLKRLGNASTQLQQIINESGTNDKEIRTILADVQARALEYTERMILKETALVDEAILLYSDEKMLEEFTSNSK